MSPQAVREPIDRVADPALQAILKHLIDRDALDREAWMQTNSQVNNLSVVTQGLQNDVAKLIAIGERQIELQLQFNTSAQVLEQLRDQMREEKAERLLVSAAAQRYEGSLRTLKGIVGATLPVGVLLVGFVYNTLADRIADVKITHAQDTAEGRAAREKLRERVEELSRTRAVQ